MPQAAETDSEDDETLVARAVRGDLRAGRLIWARYAPLVGRTLRHVFGSSPDAVDLAQEVFLRVFQQLGNLRQPEALRAFIIGICLRVARHQIRSKRVRSVVGLAASFDWIPAPAVDHDSRAAVRRLVELVDGLGPQDRALFVSRYVEQMDLEQIAALHQMSFSTTRRRVDRMTRLVSARGRGDDLLAAYFESFRPPRQASMPACRRGDPRAAAESHRP